MGFRLFFILALACALGCAQNEADRQFIEDRAGLLTPGQRHRIREYHRALFDDLDVHFHLTILDVPAVDINRKAVELFDALRLGKQTKGAKGLLLLVDPVNEQVRMEVGYDLESIYTDGFVGYVQREQMAPFFAADRIGAGIEATVELLVSRAQGKVDLASLEGGAVEMIHGSGGGGAESRVPIGVASPNTDASPNNRQFAPGKTPLESLNVYLNVLGEKIKAPHLALYTPETRRFLSEWLVTDAQQNNEHKGLRQHLSSAQTVISGGRAVVKFPVEARAQPPYFFRKSEAGWHLDLAAMSRNIRFNHKNQWHFASTGHEYMFAFDKNRIGPNGFLR